MICQNSEDLWEHHQRVLKEIKNSNTKWPGLLLQNSFVFRILSKSKGSNQKIFKTVKPALLKKMMDKH